MLKVILIVLAALGAATIAVLIFASTRPDTFHVVRKTHIKASPDKVFALINDFHFWIKWSPWEKMDLTMQKAFSGTAAGVGTIYEWEGN